MNLNEDSRPVQSLDETDYQMLHLLQQEGRLSNVELAKRLHLSPPATHARWKRLEREGYIEGYSARINARLVGFDMSCFIHLNLEMHQPEDAGRVHEELLKFPQVLELHHVTGETDYLLKVIFRNRSELEEFVVSQLMTIPGIARIRTSLVLREINTTKGLPLH